jgi:CheY-like chemotaxis protein
MGILMTANLKAPHTAKAHFSASRPPSYLAMAKKVLIVDDHEHLRHILAAILRFCGYEILEAATAAQAIESALSAKPHLILMDIQLPDFSGLEAARLIRQNPAIAHIPIVGCTAVFGPEMRPQALAAGMVEYLQKPVSSALLIATVEKFVAGAGQKSSK